MSSLSADMWLCVAESVAASPNQTLSKAREALRAIHQSKHLDPASPTHPTRLNGLWLAAYTPAHRSATMASTSSTEFDLSKCFKGEQQLVYVYTHAAFVQSRS